MIPLIEEEVVHRKGWVSEEDIYNLFAVSQSVPGAIAINTATLIGYRRKGKSGAVAATLGVVLPSLFIIIAIASFFSRIEDSLLVKAVFKGINGAVVALILLASLKMVKASVKDWVTGGIMAVSVIVILLTDLSPIYLILLAALGSSVYYFFRIKSADNRIEEEMKKEKDKVAMKEEKANHLKGRQT